MGIIEKKEIKDMFASYKAVLGLILGTVMPVLLKWRGIEPFAYFYLAMMLMSLCQYIYDSYTTDTENKGILFLYNLGFNSKTIILKKLLVTLGFFLFMFLINIPFAIECYCFFDIFWILPLVLVCSGIMLVVAMLSQSSEMTTNIITMSVILVLTFVLWAMKNMVLKIFLAHGLALGIVLLAIKIADSMIYRKQL